MRESTSLGPPGGNAIRSETGLVGYAAVGTADMANASTTAAIPTIIVMLRAADDIPIGRRIPALLPKSLARPDDDRLRTERCRARSATAAEMTLLRLFIAGFAVRNSRDDLVVVCTASQTGVWSCVVVGLLATWMFLTVILAYLFTEYLLRRLDVRRRIFVGQGWSLFAILGADAVSLLVVWISSLVLMFAADVHLYSSDARSVVGAQGVWLSQHLWSYYRGHVRLC